VASPSMMARMAASISSSLRSLAAVARAMACLIPMRSGGMCEEVAQEIVARFREDRFGVELDAEDGQLAVAQPHDLLRVAFRVFRPCRDFEAVRQGLAVHHQRVIARRREGRPESLEEIRTAMMNG